MDDADFQVLDDCWPCLVVGKPSGLLTQAPPGIDCLERRLRDSLEGESVYLGVPHRLDRPASGVMVFGRTRRATRKLSDQFRQRRVRKIYWALVAGQIVPAEGTWTDTMRKIPGRGQAELVPDDHPHARQAVLHYRTRACREWGCWLEIELETGRTHQIRLQAASRGCPILGDGQYGSTIPFGRQHEDVRLRPIALHARRIEFIHPTTREPVVVTCPLPASWQGWIAPPHDR